MVQSQLQRLDILKYKNKEQSYVFNKLLINTNAETIVNKLELISKQNNDCDIALICYEKVGDFCHRHLVAKWLNNSNILDYSIEEYQL